MSVSSVLSLRGITKYFGEGDARLQVLKGIDLEVLEGEFVAIMGPSGSGKSTLLNLLGCLDRPTDGAYYLEGENVADVDSCMIEHLVSPQAMVRLLQLTSLLQSDDPAATSLRKKLKGQWVVAVAPPPGDSDDAGESEDRSESRGADAAAGGESV